MSDRLYIQDRLPERWTGNTPRPFLAQGVSRGTSRNTFRSRSEPVEPASSRPPGAGRFHTGTPRSRPSPTACGDGQGSGQRTSAPMTRNTGCSFLALQPASTRQCSRLAIWAPDPAVRLSENRVDAYYTSLTLSSYTSRIGHPFIAVKPLAAIYLTHIMDRQVPFLKLA